MVTVVQLHNYLAEEFKRLPRETELEYLLMGFSEWLDQQDLIVGPAESGDDRSHEELVRDFLAPSGAGE